LLNVYYCFPLALDINSFLAEAYVICDIHKMSRTREQKKRDSLKYRLNTPKKMCRIWIHFLS